MIIDPNKQSFQDNYKLMIGSIVPRPIAFVSTKSKDGIDNVAPFSFFNGVCSNPPTISFCPVRRGSDGQIKDTLKNIQDTGVFSLNIVSESFASEMVETATEYPSDVSEFEASGLTPIPCENIDVMRVGESKISFECELNQIIDIGDGSLGSGSLVLGTIVLFHIADELYEQGRIDLEALQPIGRLAGANGYCRTTDRFEIQRKVKPEQ
ncbi:MAG: flavin reductase family protein [Candidatus Marinimicrobia bacterium]|jgi:flavin reductase (DIM6/NTAB) family NADH-FMN oxidoreductase RutF|nr:flavin reductase family protein [Candidatus Neomarinimicrobiota bacterium]MBT3496957.1 flavin reductase family protein [Candidatus Neomarinimicrobiota bacterium]MBT3692145.1 flavin reductase family protein [Candidatus Neomarinimicrobiota bacterium]MBT3732961.1 flavin reductase family protein [Candidatus Neomarinimicrobiota bacterium]MBT4143869.1 flavin reductase family protein [Candidatus Neomarinimicrobiota bacterium]